LQGVKSSYFRLDLATTQRIPAASQLILAAGQLILAAGQLILGATSLTRETLFCRTTPFLQEKPDVKPSEFLILYKRLTQPLDQSGRRVLHRRALENSALPPHPAGYPHAPVKKTKKYSPPNQIGYYTLQRQPPE
jgi:hypothetical protein